MIADHLPENERESFLNDNAEAAEQISYQKDYTDEELADIKDRLSIVDQEIDEVEEDKKATMASYNAGLKSQKKVRKGFLRDIRNGNHFVDELCYKFIVEETFEAMYYNSAGKLVIRRPMKAEEYQRSIFPLLKDTGVKPAKPE